MIKKSSDLFDLLNISKQKKDFDNILSVAIDLIKKETGIELNSDNFILKNNLLKIKTTSNNKFLILMNVVSINQKLSDTGFIVEL